tara:strand:- start:1945 stop:2046 length:102 start_codon:yes stop_codon:yes gene_type:complete
MSPRARYKLELVGAGILISLTILGGLAAMCLIR